jgi:hypothetical protein
MAMVHCVYLSSYHELLPYTHGFYFFIHHNSYVYILRYDVAALANLKMDIPIQKKLVDTICNGLEQDDEWDETDLFQKA